MYLIIFFSISRSELGFLVTSPVQSAQASQPWCSWNSNSEMHTPSFAQQTCRILCLDCRHHLILPGTCSERGPFLHKRWKIIPSGILSVLRMYYSWVSEDDVDYIPQHHTGTTIRCRILATRGNWSACVFRRSSLHIVVSDCVQLTAKSSAVFSSLLKSTKPSSQITLMRNYLFPPKSNGS